MKIREALECEIARVEKVLEGLNPNPDGNYILIMEIIEDLSIARKALDDNDVPAMRLSLERLSKL